MEIYLLRSLLEDMRVHHDADWVQSIQRRRLGQHSKEVVVLMDSDGVWAIKEGLDVAVQFHDNSDIKRLRVSFQRADASLSKEVSLTIIAKLFREQS